MSAFQVYRVGFAVVLSGLVSDYVHEADSIAGQVQPVDFIDDMTENVEG